MFANQAGLDMLETTLVALQDITLEKIFDESGRKALCSDFAKLMQQVKSKKKKNSLVRRKCFETHLSCLYRDMHACLQEYVCLRWEDM